MGPIAHYLLHAVPSLMLVAAVHAYYFSPLLLASDQAPDITSDEVESRLKLFAKKHQFPLGEMRPGAEKISQAEKFNDEQDIPPTEYPTVKPSAESPPAPDLPFGETKPDAKASLGLGAGAEAEAEASPDEQSFPGMKNLNLGAPRTFSWENCGSPTDPVHITKIDVRPVPVQKKGDTFFDMHIEFLEDVNGPLTLDSHTQRMSMGSWTDVDCQGYFGTCHYDDVCPMLNRMATCPPQLLRKMPCKCPFKKGKYEVDNSKITNDLPSYATGQYRSTIKLSRNGLRLGCYTVHYSVA